MFNLPKLWKFSLLRNLLLFSALEYVVMLGALLCLLLRTPMLLIEIFQGFNLISSSGARPHYVNAELITPVPTVAENNGMVNGNGQIR